MKKAIGVLALPQNPLEKLDMIGVKTAHGRELLSARQARSEQRDADPEARHWSVHSQFVLRQGNGHAGTEFGSQVE